jgi:hypothetical protein
MTAAEKIKWLILRSAGQDIEFGSEAVNDLFDELSREDEFQGAIEDVRTGGDETNVPATYSRCYESISKAAKLPDGSWVGWTHWYGGGKHGCPDEIEWIDDAYDLELEEEKEVVVIQRKFKVKE